jgi:hypothetical protein
MHYNGGRNRVAVGDYLMREPNVAAWPQRWALGRNPVGITEEYHAIGESPSG